MEYEGFYKVECLEIATNRKFIKTFDSIFLAKKFEQQFKHSKKVKVIRTVNFF